MTSKNQVTLPKAAVEQVGNPTHFRVQVAQGAIILFPASLVVNEAANEAMARVEELGITDVKLRKMLKKLGAKG
ncbi:hypothetical protein [Muricoccus radiodurans]|uniref:hypothetical protein n=1 Tax=Muricoccus radiodurans TaxID=2231721 RepID=UPI003CEECB40